MPLIKLKTGQQASQSQSQAQDGVAPPTPAAPSPSAASPQPSSAGGAKLKLKNSQPPTPATEHPAAAPAGVGPGAGAGAGSSQQKKKQAGASKPAQKPTNKGVLSKKRAANEDLSPAGVKRVASDADGQRRVSLKLKTGSGAQAAGPESATPGSAAKFKLGGPRKPSTEFRRPTLIAKRRVPDRPKGVGYDSEDSDREEDPAIQQGLVLRMQPGEDADTLRHAIANGKIGVKREEGGMNVSLRFITNDLRRAVVRVADRMYGAVLVDLPCIVESMKSWDKKGWWKVADVHQMLLVLGRVTSEDEAKSLPLPRDVDKETMQYAHGLTPPMHHVRKRRFRRRVNYRQMENVEEEVERLLREDDEWERNTGAQVKVQEYTQAEWERLQNEPDHPAYDSEMDAEGDAVETVEHDDTYQQQWDQLEDDEETAALEAQMGDAFAEDDAPPTTTNPTTHHPHLPGEPGPVSATDLITTASPAPLPDRAPTLSAIDPTLPPPSSSSAAPTPTAASTPAHPHPDDPSAAEDSDEDDDSDSDSDDPDSPDAVDEDAAARAAERQQQREEVADLEREIGVARAKTAGMTNQLLKRREREKLGKLEEDLKMKRAAFGLEEEEEGEEEVGVGVGAEGGKG